MSLPSIWTHVHVVGTFLAADGTPCTGRVTFTPSIPVIVDGIVVVPRAITAALDADGQVSVMLPATTDPDISPTGWVYMVEERIFPRGRGTYALAIPHNATEINLDTAPILPPVPTPVDPTPYVGPPGPAGPVGPAGPAATVTADAVQDALSDDPAGARAALALGSAAMADVGSFDPAGSAAALTAADVDALPISGGVITSSAERPLQFLQTGHPAAADAGFALGIGGSEGYASAAILWTRHSGGPDAGQWVRRMIMDPYGATIRGVLAATKGLGCSVLGHGSMPMVVWENAGSLQGVCLLGHAMAYEGFGRADTHVVFGPNPTSRWQVRSPANYQSDALKLDLDWSGNLTAAGAMSPGHAASIAAAPDASAHPGAYLNITGAVDGFAPCWSDGTNWINLLTGAPIA